MLTTEISWTALVRRDDAIYYVRTIIQYNTLLTTPHGGFSVTMELKEVIIVSKFEVCRARFYD